MTTSNPIPTVQAPPQPHPGHVKSSEQPEITKSPSSPNLGKQSSENAGQTGPGDHGKGSADKPTRSGPKHTKHESPPKIPAAASKDAAQLLSLIKIWHQKSVASSQIRNSEQSYSAPLEALLHPQATWSSAAIPLAFFHTFHPCFRRFSPSTGTTSPVTRHFFGLWARRSCLAAKVLPSPVHLSVLTCPKLCASGRTISCWQCHAQDIRNVFWRAANVASAYEDGLVEFDRSFRLLFLEGVHDLVNADRGGWNLNLAWERTYVILLSLLGNDLRKLPAWTRPAVVYEAIIRKRARRCQGQRFSQRRREGRGKSFLAELIKTSPLLPPVLKYSLPSNTFLIPHSAMRIHYLFPIADGIRSQTLS